MLQDCATNSPLSGTFSRERSLRKVGLKSGGGLVGVNLRECTRSVLPNWERGQIVVKRLNCGRRVSIEMGAGGFGSVVGTPSVRRGGKVALPNGRSKAKGGVQGTGDPVRKFFKFRNKWKGWKGEASKFFSNGMGHGVGWKGV